MKNTHKPYGLYEKHFKRFLDIVCSILAVLFFWWLYLIIAFLVKVKLGSPVLFVQKRIGKDEQIFELYKFRSMSNEKDENGQLLPDTERLTKFGRFLRAASLDELPEVFNILKGEMSILGPRPLVEGYLPYYTEEERHRHDVRPGLSGLAQIHGRNCIQWEERFAYDLEYVNHITFLTDVRILLYTVKYALKEEGVQVRGTGEVEDFDVYRRRMNSRR